MGRRYQAAACRLKVGLRCCSLAGQTPPILPTRPGLGPGRLDAQVSLIGTGDSQLFGVCRLAESEEGIMAGFLRPGMAINLKYQVPSCLPKQIECPCGRPRFRW